MRRGIHSWCGCAGTAAWHATVKCARHENSGGKPGYSFYKNVHYQGKQVALEVAQAEAALTRKFNAKRGKGRHAPLKAKIICVRLKTAKKMAPWILLTNAGITAWEAAQYDNCRWRIETTANC